MNVKRLSANAFRRRAPREPHTSRATMGAFRAMLGEPQKKSPPRAIVVRTNRFALSGRTERELQLAGALCALVGFIFGRLTARARDADGDADALEVESVADVIAARVAAPRDLTGEAESSRGVVGAIARVVGGRRDADADARARQLGVELAMKTESYVRDIEVESAVLSNELAAATRGAAAYDAFMSTLRTSAWDDPLAGDSTDYADFSLSSMEKYGVDVSMTLSDDGDGSVAA